MKPFDLEAAKRGEPIQTRDGRPVKFIAHVPDAYEDSRLVIQCGNDVYLYCDNGKLTDHGCGSRFDLFMAPRKRTVWVNLYRSDESRSCVWHPTKKLADETASHGRIGNRAWPLEIENACMRFEDNIRAIGERDETT